MTGQQMDRTAAWDGGKCMEYEFCGRPRDWCNRSGRCCPSFLGGALMLAAMTLAAPLLPAYLATGLVPRLPTALLSVALALTAVVSVACGLILNVVTRARMEAKHLAYLSISPHRASS